MFDSFMQLLPVNIEKLEKTKDIESLKKILVNYRDRDKRTKAAYALGRIKGEPHCQMAADVLTAFADDDIQDEPLRCHCILALGQQKTEAIEKLLIKFLGNDSESIRADAVRALSDFDSVAAACGIAEKLNDISPKVFSAVSDALNLTGETLLTALKNTLYSDNETIRAKAAKELGAAKVRKISDLLIKVMNGGDDLSRKRAALALGYFEPDAVVNQLMARADKETGDNLAAIYAAVGRVKTEKTVDFLVEGLNKQNSAIMEACIYSLCEKKSDKAITKLFDILSDFNALLEYRMAVAKALGKIKNVESLKVMAETLKTAPDPLRTRLEEALIEMNHSETLTYLLPLLESTSEKERLSAAKILIKMKNQVSAARLLPLIKDSNLEIRNLVILGFGEFRDNDVTEALFAILSDKTQPSQIRGNAARSLGSIADPRMLHPLFDLLKDDDERVRGSVAFALGSYKKPEVIEMLGNTLKDSSELVRSMVVEALGQMKDPKTLEYLKKSETDPSEKVRLTASRVLRSM